MDGKVFNIRYRCFYFSKKIIEFINETKYPYVFRSLFEQLVRSATSIGANVVEAKAGSSRKDWRSFILIALKSSNETKYWLCLIRETMNVGRVRVEELLREADEISKILASIVKNAGIR